MTHRKNRFTRVHSQKIGSAVASNSSGAKNPVSVGCGGPEHIGIICSVIGPDSDSVVRSMICLATVGPSWASPDLPSLHVSSATVTGSSVGMFSRVSELPLCPPIAFGWKLHRPCSFVTRVIRWLGHSHRGQPVVWVDDGVVRLILIGIGCCRFSWSLWVAMIAQSVPVWLLYAATLICPVVVCCVPLLVHVVRITVRPIRVPLTCAFVRT